MSQTVTPYLLYEDADAAVEFLTRAFGFREVDRTVGAAGGAHVEMEVAPGSASIYLGAPPSGFRNPAKVGRTSLTYVLVDHVGAHYERAKAEGASIFEEPTDMPFGHRRYSCEDPQGHQWSFAQVLGDA
jgi:uncharacterized glyoxalase superfamily protein PhnB